MKDVNGWIVPDFDRVIAKQCRLFPETHYQQDILNWALFNIKNFNLAVDVGANIGLHSVRFAQKFSQVESFEPFSINMIHFKQRMAACCLKGKTTTMYITNQKHLSK